MTGGNGNGHLGSNGHAPSERSALNCHTGPAGQPPLNVNSIRGLR
jgi:hypothetical protein